MMTISTSRKFDAVDILTRSGLSDADIRAAYAALYKDRQRITFLSDDMPPVDEWDPSTERNAGLAGYIVVCDALMRAGCRDAALTTYRIDNTDPYWWRRNGSIVYESYLKEPDTVIGFCLALDDINSDTDLLDRYYRGFTAGTFTGLGVGNCHSAAELRTMSDIVEIGMRHVVPIARALNDDPLLRALKRRGVNRSDVKKAARKLLAEHDAAGLRILDRLMHHGATQTLFDAAGALSYDNVKRLEGDGGLPAEILVEDAIDEAEEGRYKAGREMLADYIKDRNKLKRLMLKLTGNKTNAEPFALKNRDNERLVAQPIMRRLISRLERDDAAEVVKLVEPMLGEPLTGWNGVIMHVYQSRAWPSNLDACRFIDYALTDDDHLRACNAALLEWGEVAREARNNRESRAAHLKRHPEMSCKWSGLYVTIDDARDAVDRRLGLYGTDESWRRRSGQSAQDGATSATGVDADGSTTKGRS